MIELLFGESEAASMKAAKSCDRNRSIRRSKVSRPVSAETAKKSRLAGTPEEVICLAFMLDIGDIRQPIDGPYRKNLICSLYNQNQWEQDRNIRADLEGACDLYAEGLHRLCRYLDAKEPVRIWYSDAPYSRCGLYHLCHILRKYETEVSVVKLPEHVVRGKTITSYKHWGEADETVFEELLPLEKKLSKEEIRLYSCLWSELTEDNSPLRAYINGRILGVPEYFYDFLIWQHLTETPVKEARLIGDILGCSQINTGDWWFARRIEHHIRQGRIRIIEDSKKIYARQIALAGKDPVAV